MLNSAKRCQFFCDNFTPLSQKEKNVNILNFASYLIEKFYVKLCLNTNLNLPVHMNNFSIIMNQIYKMKKFNLYEKNTLTLINETLRNEAK